MKKVLFPILALVLVLGLTLPVAAHTEDAPSVTDLIAGQHMDVGDVNVWNDGTNLYVQYVVDASWILTESHLYVGKSDPTVIDMWSTPGQLPYSPGMEKSPSPGATYDAATMTYTVPLDEIYEYVFVGKGKGKGLNAVEDGGVEPCENVYIAAHGVVQEAPPPAVLYATERGRGDIYSIDPVAASSSLLLDISTVSVTPAIRPIDGASPNGNAFDAANQRFYFASFQNPGSPPSGTSPSELYFVDLDDAPGTIVHAGTLIGHASDGTFYGGKYWYIGHGTDELQAVTLNSDGTVASETTAASNISSGTSATTGYLSFGDIEFDCNGLLFVSAAVRDGTNAIVGWLSGTYDMPTSVFNEFGSFAGLQIAFGSDGTLYGHNAGTGNFYTIDTSTGATSYAFNDRTFTDLAGNRNCEWEPIVETAWGEGDPFGTNWAMYFEYHVQWPMELGGTGDYTAEWVTDPVHSGCCSVRLATGDWTGPSADEGRIVITLPSGTTLGQIQSISWWTYLVSGYVPHVDMVLDKDSDTVRDDVLVAEGAYQNGDSTTGWSSPPWFETFDGASATYPGWSGLIGTPSVTEVDNTSAVWLWSSGQASIDTLSAYKAGTAVGTVDSTTPVLALEIEVDNWVVTSEAYVDDIAISLSP